MVVLGKSMLPTFEEGDRVLALAPRLTRPLSPRRRRLRTGDVVVIADPRQPGRSGVGPAFLKRVCAAYADGIEVRGDNPEASTDSRHFGPVPWEAVLGIVVYRYFPPGRVSWWPGRNPGLGRNPGPGSDARPGDADAV